MKKFKSLLMLPILAAVMLTALSCGKGEPANTNLQGTKWKLEGIVTEQTGEMRVLEPIECEQCYTLEFDTDTTATGYACANILLLHLGYSSISLGIGTYINYCGEEELFCNVSRFITHYEYNSANFTLKFFYKHEEKNYYLLFKKLPQ